MPSTSASSRAAAPSTAARTGLGRGAAGARDRALFANFFKRELTTRYLGSTTGIAWALLHPLALLAVYHFVFTTVFRAGNFGGKSFLLFVAVALWPWLAAQEAMQRATISKSGRVAPNPPDQPSRRPPSRRSSPAEPGAGASASRPRHPSAGNLGDRPVLVNPADPTTAVSTLAFPQGAAFDPSAVRLGPGLTDDSIERLVGSGDGRRVLELGCGDGSNAVALARQGARVIVVDSSAARLAVARANAEANDVRVEFHHADLADLAFVRADQIDVCLAVYSLTEVADVSRVFRQVERVLRTEAHFVISLPHPLEYMAEGDPDQDGVRLLRSAFDRSRVAVPGSSTAIEPHRITDIFTTLTRSNFRVDALLEPPMDASAEGGFASPVHEWVPATFIIRGRKQGI